MVCALQDCFIQLCVSRFPKYLFRKCDHNVLLIFFHVNIQKNGLTCPDEFGLFEYLTTIRGEDWVKNRGSIVFTNLWPVGLK